VQRLLEDPDEVGGVGLRLRDQGPVLGRVDRGRRLEHEGAERGALAPERRRRGPPRLLPLGDDQVLDRGFYAEEGDVGVLRVGLSLDVVLVELAYVALEPAQVAHREEARPEGEGHHYHEDPIRVGRRLAGRPREPFTHEYQPRGRNQPSAASSSARAAALPASSIKVARTPLRSKATAPSFPRPIFSEARRYSSSSSTSKSTGSSVLRVARMPRFRNSLIG